MNDNLFYYFEDVSKIFRHTRSKARLEDPVKRVILAIKKLITTFLLKTELIYEPVITPGSTAKVFLNICVR